MINFYRTWKEDKESEPQKKKKFTFQCVICNRKTNGLKDHMNGVHGAGTYLRYVRAQEIVKEQARLEILNVMYKDE
tara:strand:- start:250 stop:477 length:228 start_codon:yes stop_codon:yes gene_type:complete